MFDSINFDGKEVLVNQMDYLRKHDLIYKAPAYKGYEAMPLGNGDLACMLWNTERSLELVINKSDTIDFIEDGEMQAWAWETEEKNTAAVSCGKISISDGMPSFDTLYLDNFEERLNIAQAYADLNCSTPFSNWSSRIYAIKPDDVLIIDVKCSSEEPVERKIQLERWGSRNFFHYYELLVKQPSLKLGGTYSGEKAGCTYIKQDLRGTSFVICTTLIAEDYSINQNNCRCIEYVLGKSTKAEFKLLVTVVTGKEDEPLLDLAIGKLKTASEKLDSLFNEHCDHWKNFWMKSFIHLEDDDYLENIYYMNLYQLNSCATGKYPPLFTGGAWTWNHDIRNWGHYYHWNQQQTYWGVYTSNHSELVQNYLDFRFNMLPNAIFDAKKQLDKNGAFFSDICNHNGYQCFEPDTVCNYTVGSQIAMDFYKDYKYSGDKNFLKFKAYPFMKACGEFYIEILEKYDGTYHITGGATAYESYWILKDTITDYSMIKALFSALIEAAGILNIDKDMLEIWRDHIDNLFELPITDFTSDNGILKIASSGIKWDGTTVGYSEGIYPMAPFPASQLSHVFPSGVIGLKDAGTEAFEIAVNTARVFIENDVYKEGKVGFSGHSPIPAVAARLGLKDKTKKLLDFYVQSYQVFPNGLTHFLKINQEQGWSQKFKVRLLKGDEKNTRWKMLHEKTEGERICIPSEQHLHAFFESASNIMAGINEMLLQSYDGIIRVFPAAPDAYNAIFTLLSVGNFLVTSQKNMNDVKFIHIKSNIGGRCEVLLPWDEDVEILCDKTRLQEFEIKNGVLSFETIKEQTYLIQRKALPALMYYYEHIISYVNNNVKTNGPAILGKERNF